MDIPNKTRHSAFTLVELVVVISVLAIVMGITVPKVKGMMDQSKMVKAQKELTTLESAVEEYYTFSNNIYPPTTSAPSASYLVNIQPQIISTPLYDPFVSSGNAEYQYILSSNGKYYAIYSVGVNQQGAVTNITNSGAVSATVGTICATNGTGCNAPGQNGSTCSSGANCLTGRCVSGACTSGLNGQRCGSNSDCASGYCNSLLCTDGSIGSWCYTGASCQSGICNSAAQCSLNSLLPLESACTAPSNSSCQSGYCGGYMCSDGSNGSYCIGNTNCQSGVCRGSHCINGLSDGSNGSSCTNNGQCSGYCSSGVNGDPCSTSADCAGGHCYNNWICSDGANGAACQTAADCQSGFCVSYQCAATGATLANGTHCYQSASCTGGYCVMNGCTDGSNGSVCRFATDCRSGNCVSNVCHV